ncbi:conserved exported hypothetical protein [Candidatus Terasakiella magnetica]|uniref:Lipoprotein n=1 Tax=Candidatus Terasakiella magnetica TaxID=1867952 RepID=A0A1C3RHX4_9PROT|nr:hypothetical protein [Candidatus Terasakiella magnetica]SCA56870.1 conserved exported hypothetical protein [Candidatus Terasakiella magnetica]
MKKLISSFLLSCGLSLFLSACASHGPYKQTASLSALPLPTYHVGDTFIYTNGYSETVKQINGEKITWQAGSATEVVAYRNFLLPSLHWQTHEKESHGLIHEQPDMMFPLNHGNDERFTMTRTVIDKLDGQEKEYVQAWDCTVDGSYEITVAAGTFDTMKISCYRFYRTWLRQTRIFYYAPSINHYVLREDQFKSRPSHKIELASYIPSLTFLSATDQKSLQESFQLAMEHNLSNVGVNWFGKGKRAQSTIKPLKSFRTDRALFCRTFEQSIAYGEFQRNFFGNVCRHTDGIWRYTRVKTHLG